MATDRKISVGEQRAWNASPSLFCAAVRSESFLHAGQSMIMRSSDCQSRSASPPRDLRRPINCKQEHCLRFMGSLCTLKLIPGQIQQTHLKEEPHPHSDFFLIFFYLLLLLLLFLWIILGIHARGSGRSSVVLLQSSNQLPQVRSSAILFAKSSRDISVFRVLADDLHAPQHVIRGPFALSSSC